MLESINNYLCSLITILAGVSFVRFSLDKKTKSKMLSAVLLMIFIPLVFLVLFHYELLILKTLLFCFIYFVLFKYVFKLTCYQSLLTSIIFMLILTVSEIIVFLFLSEILTINNGYLYNSFGGSILSNVIIGCIAVLLGRINRKWLCKVINMKLKNYLVVYVTLLFGCIIYFFYVTFSNIGNGISVFSGIMIIIVLLSVLSSLIIQAYKNNQLMIKYDKLLDFIKKYEIEIDNQRTMRHEIKNQLLTIKSKLLDKDENLSIINYINEIIADNNKEINHTLYAKFNSLPSNGLKGLFYFKVSEAIDKNIDVSINISKKISDSILNNLNSVMFNQLGKLFGILLDNAIEASEISIKKQVGIEIYVNEDGIYFIVSNTYNKIKYKSNGLFYSTKSKNRGHGLLLAKTIVNSNNRLSLNTMISDELFTQKLIIK